jgi:hypothetical protein
MTIAALLVAAQVTCQTTGVYTRCWDSQTGATVSVTTHDAGGYSHTTMPDGRAYTTWDRPNGTSQSWQNPGTTTVIQDRATARFRPVPVLPSGGFCAVSARL